MGISAYEKIGWSTLKTDYVYDGRGSVALELTYNSSRYTLGGALSKKTVENYSYTPFGEILTGEGSGYRFNGEYYDSTTRMVNLRARQYEPAVMRFVQRDLLKGDQSAPLSLNRYLYCENDSVNFVDPSGQSLASLWNKAKAAVSTAVKKVTTSKVVQASATTTKTVQANATTVSAPKKTLVSTIASAVKSGIVNTAKTIATAATTIAANVKTTVSNTRTQALDWYGRNEETINKCLTTAAVVLGTAAFVVLAVASAGTVAAAAGVMFAGTALAGSASTLATIGVYGLATVAGLFGASNVGEVWTGKNVVRDTVFGGNQTVYDVAQVGVAALSMGVSSFASYNSGLLRSAPTVDNPADEVGAGSAGEYAGKQAAGAAQSESAGTTACSEAGSTSTTRVGRWMSIDEYNAMQKTGKVQMSPEGNTTYIANPADPNAFKGAPTGSVYVEFDVPTNSVKPAGNSMWGQIPGPGSNLDKYEQILKGAQPIIEMPDAMNIQLLGGK